MTGLLLYLAVALGVAVSIALPLIRSRLPKPPAAAARTIVASNWWAFARPYLITGIFSLIVALILVAFLGDTLDTWQKAFLAGYTADSTLQKITT